MAAIDDILQSLPIDQLAQQVGADPQEVQQAAQAALPALLGGLHANAQDPGGASSIVEALVPFFAMIDSRALRTVVPPTAVSTTVSRRAEPDAFSAPTSRATAGSTGPS